MKRAPGRFRPLLLACLLAGLASPRAPAIAEWRIEATARVPGETGLTEVLVADAPRPADRATPGRVAPRYASGKIRRAPVEEAVIRPVAAIVASQAPGTPAAPSAEGGQAEEAPLLLAGSETVADGTLDSLRGGFETASGLQLSFGIERLVYVNGELSSVTSINVADLGKLSGGAAVADLSAGTSIALIQNGADNAFVAGELNAAALATVIQNSLDNQRIQAVTTITATVNSMEMLKAHRLQQTLQDALGQSLLR